MQALLHIPSGELVEFVKVNERAHPNQGGAFYKVRLGGKDNLHHSGYKIYFHGMYDWRDFLLEFDNLPILLTTVCVELSENYQRSEFEVIEI